MVVCKICKGNCDHGELVQGICPECMETRKKIEMIRRMREEDGKRVGRSGVHGNWK